MDRFRPRYTVSETAREAILDLERLERDLQQYEADDALARRILRDALARNTYGTASIEGNPMSLQQVESLLQRAPTPDRVEVPDEREILNLAAFLEDLDAHPVPRTCDDVVALHADLFAGVIPEPGRLKQQQNFVGRRHEREVVYVPTEPERVTKELQASLDWFHSSTDHPAVRVAVWFHEFQSIHPFPDGNGRLGRAIAAVMLHHLGYPGVRYAPVDYGFNQDRDAYYAALQDARLADWDLTGWLDFMLLVLRDAYRDAAQRFLFRDRLPVQVADRAARVAEWLARLDRGNRGRRVKVNDVQAAFPQVPRRTLQRDLAALVDAGILERLGAGRGAAYRLHREDA